MLRNSIDGMENIFHNDIYQGATIIVYGPPGSLKSGMVFSVLSKYLQNSGEFGMYLTVEENTISHLRNMDSLGIDVPENLLISDYSDIRSRFESPDSQDHPDFLDMVDGVIKFFKDKRGAETLEHAIVGVLIVVAAIVGLRALGVNIGDLFTRLAATIGGSGN